jgi:DNA anti-recombination protein RmuC
VNNKRRRLRELIQQHNEEIVEKNMSQSAKTPDDIFSEIMSGLGKLYLAIEKLSTLSEKSEIEGETLRRCAEIT